VVGGAAAHLNTRRTFCESGASEGGAGALAHLDPDARRPFARGLGLGLALGARGE
jgi:hypothetical protein